MDVKKFCFRVLFYVLGLFVMAIGVTVASNSNLGIDGYPTSLVFLGTVVSAVFVGVVMGPIQTFIIPPSAASALERLPSLPLIFPTTSSLGPSLGGELHRTGSNHRLWANHRRWFPFPVLSR